MKAVFRPALFSCLAAFFFAISVENTYAQCCIEINGFTITPDPGQSGSIVNFILQATTVDSSEKTAKKNWLFDTANKYIAVDFCFNAKSYPIQTTHIDTVSIPANLLKAIGTYTVFAGAGLSNNDCSTVGSNDTIYRTYKVFPVGLRELNPLNSSLLRFDPATDLLFLNVLSPDTSIRISSIEGVELLRIKDWQGDPISLHGFSDGCYNIEIVCLGQKTHRRFMKI